MKVFPWLSVVTFAPLIGAAVLAVMPKGRDALYRWVALVASVLTFVVALGMLGAYDEGVRGFQLVEQATWVGPLNLR